MNVGQVRAIPEQRVQHSPVFGHPDLTDNRAHTDVHGSKEQGPETQLAFRRIATVVLPLSPEE